MNRKRKESAAPAQARQEKLLKLRGWFEQACQSDAFTHWQRDARECFNFYDGVQWSDAEATKLAEHGQPAIVINKIAAKVDNLAGMEVSGRTRVVYRSRSGAPDEEQTAQALTDVALYVAEQSEQATAISQVFRDGLVGGIGWLDVGVEQSENGPRIFCRAEDPFSVVWDPACRRADLSDARFVARERWLSGENLKDLFGDAADRIRAMVGVEDHLATLRPPFSAERGSSVDWYMQAQGLFRVVEIQYREAASQWMVRRPDGSLVKSWLAPAADEGMVEEVNAIQRVRVAYLCGDMLLDDRWLADGYDGFTLVPYLYRRQKSDGRPYGMVRAAIDPQRELNKRRSKAMHILSTAQIIADVDAVDDPALLAREAARPDGIILKRAGKDLRILRNTDLAAGQVAVMEQAARDIQEVIGIYDETLGKESNAVSGIAIQQRQLAGSLGQMTAFDALRLMKKKLGRHVLGLIRQVFSAEMIVRITDLDGGARLIKLNERVMDAEGRPMVVRDISAGDYDVVIEEVRDVLSAREQEARQLEMLLKAGVPVPPAVLVEASGVRHKNEILSALTGERPAAGTLDSNPNGNL